MKNKKFYNYRRSPNPPITLLWGCGRAVTAVLWDDKLCGHREGEQLSGGLVSGTARGLFNPSFAWSSAPFHSSAWSPLSIVRVLYTTP